MKRIICLFFVALSVTAMKAVIPVTIDFSANWPLEQQNWAQLLARMQCNIEQTSRIIGKTDELIRLAGEPSHAVDRVTDLDKLVTDVRALTDKVNTADKVAEKLDLTEALERSPNKQRANISGQVETFGVATTRNVGELSAALKYEAVVEKTRAMVEANRKVQKQLATRLKDAEQLLQRARTEAEIEAAHAELQRITALIQAANAATENFLADAKLKKEELTVAQDIEAIARSQNVREASLAVAKEMARQSGEFRHQLAASLGEGRGAEADSAAMFGRAVLPQGR